MATVPQSEGPGEYTRDSYALARAKKASRWSPDVEGAATLRFADASPGANKLGVAASFAGHDAATFTHLATNGTTLWSVNTPSPLVAASDARILHATLYGLLLVNRPGNDNRRNILLWDLVGRRKNANREPSLGAGSIAFDPSSKRFFFAAPFWGRILNESSVYLLVSRRGNLSGFGANDWYTYRINTKVENSYAASPSIGLDSDLLVIAANTWKLATDDFNKVYFWILDKVALADNAARCPDVDVSRFRAKDDDQGEAAYSVKPAVHVDDSGPGGLFALSTQWRDDVMSEYTVWRIQKKGAGRGPRVKITSTRVSGRDFEHPPDAPQKGGGTLNTGEATIRQAGFRDGHLYGVHSLACSLGPAPNESCLRVVDLLVTNKLDKTTLTRHTTFGAGRNKFAFRGSLAVNADERVAVPFHYSASNRFLSVAYTDLPPGDGKPSKGSFLKKGNYGPKCGAGAMNVGSSTWAQVDPTDDTGFLITGEFGNAGTRQDADADCRWAARIGDVR